MSFQLWKPKGRKPKGGATNVCRWVIRYQSAVGQSGVTAAGRRSITQIFALRSLEMFRKKTCGNNEIGTDIRVVMLKKKKLSWELEKRFSPGPQESPQERPQEERPQESPSIMMSS